METKFSVFLDIKFLNTFFAHKTDLLEQDNHSDLHTWFSLYGFLKEKCRITLYTKGISKLDLAYEPENSFTRYLIEAYYQGSKDMSFMDHFPDSTKKIDYSLIEDFRFIFSSNEDHTEIEKSFGIEVLTPSTFISDWRLYTQIQEPLVIPSKENKNEFLGWRIFEHFVHPTNAMIIADRFLFGYYWNIENNLFPLLKVLLPWNGLDITFDLTILTEKIYQNKYSKLEEDAFIIYRRIENFLKDEVGLNSVNLTFCKLNNELGVKMHDRQLFTNYFFVESGMGFGCFDQHGNSTIKSPTTVEFVPETTRKMQGKFLRRDFFINEKQNLMDHADAKVIGTKTNRLFDKLNKC